MIKFSFGSVGDSWSFLFVLQFRWGVGVVLLFL